MGLFVDRTNEDGTERGMVSRGRTPGDATKAEAIEGFIILVVLVLIAWLAR